MKNIKIGIKLDKSGFQKELNNLLKNDYDIKLDSSNFKNTINELNKEISKITKNGISISTTVDEKGITSVNKYKDSVSQVTTEVKRNGQTVKQTVTENIAQFEKMKNQLQTKLSGVVGSEFVDSDLVSKLQGQLNSLDTKSSVQEFNELKSAIDNIVKSNEDLQKLAEQMANLREKSQIRVDNENSNWQLNQAKAINKALEEQYALQQKLDQQAQKAENNLNNLRNQLQSKLTTASNNSFIDTSVIDKLQTKLNSINTNTPEKEINELKSAINNLSSSDSGIVRIQNTLVKLQERISEIKKDKLDLINTTEINELKSAENEVKRLGDMLKSLQSGNVIDGKAISNQINVANNSVRTLEKSFDDLDNTTGKLSSTMKDIFSYALGGSAFYAFMNSIKSAVDTTIELDSAMRDLKRVTEETDSTYSKFMKTANQTAIELGTTTSGAIEATTRFSQLGYSFDEASESLSKYALILSNVADMSASDASSAIVSVLKGFQLETEDVSRIVDVINQAGNKFALDSNSLAEGLRIGAANLSIAGNDLEQASAMIIAGTEVMQDSDTVANGLKTIGMRLRGVSEDGEELNASLGELVKNLTGVDLTDANGEFRSTYDILIDISKVFDTLNSKEQALLLEEIAGKNRSNVLSAILQNAEQLENAYDALKDSAGSANAEQEAYMDSLEGKLNALKESFTGVSMQMIDSDMFKGLIDGATLGVTAVSKLMETFGSFPTVVTGVTGAVTILNKSFRENLEIVAATIPGIGALQDKANSYIATLNGQIQAIKLDISEKKKSIDTNISNGESTEILSKQVLGLQKQLTSATIASVSTKVAMIALQTVMTSMISFGISMLISGFTKLVDSMITTKDELKELNTEFANTYGDDKINSVDALVGKYQTLREELSTLKEGTAEYNTKQSELKTLLDEICQIYPDAITFINSDTQAKELNIGATQRLIDKDKELLEARANEVTSKNNINDVSDIEELIKSYEEAKEKVKEYNDLKAKGETSIYDNGRKVSLDGALKTAADDMEEYEEVINSLLPALKTLEEVNPSLKGSYELLSQAINNTTNEMNGVSETSDELNNSDKNAWLEDMKKKAEEAESSIKGLNDTLSGLKDTNEIIQQAIDEFNEYGELTEDTFDNILSNGTPEMIAALGDANTFLETYNRLLAEGTAEADAQRKAIIENANAILGVGDAMASVVDQNAENYSIDLQNQANATDTKLKNSIMYADQSGKAVANSVDQNGKNYTIDSENLRGSIRNKLGYADDFVNGVMEGIATFVTNAGQNYVRDSDNFVQNTNVKIKAMERLQETLDAFSTNRIEFGGGRGILNPPDDITINKTGGMLPGNYAYSSGGYVGGSAGKVSSSVGYGANSSSGSASGTNSTTSSNSETQKEVANMEKIEDRYYDLTNAIEDYNNEIEKNKLLQENASDSEKIELMKEEIALYEKQKEAIQALINEQKKEAEELKNSLSSQGVKFDANGDISNYNDILEAKVKWANSLSGDAKEQAIAQVEALAEAMERYTDLVQDSIPEQEKEWLSLMNTIADVKEEMKDIYKEQLSLVASKEQEIAELVEYYAQKQYEAKKEKVEKELELERERLEGIKKSLQEEKDLYNDNIEEEDYEASLAEERSKLAEIQAEIDRLSLDNSAAGQAKLQQALKEYEEQQKLISDMIKEHQQQVTNDRFDDEMDKVDEELEATEEEFENLLEKLEEELEEFLSPENLNKIIEEGLKTGMITVGDEVLNVQEAMAEMLKETEVGFVNVVTQTSEWIEALKEVQTIYENLSGVMADAGISSADLPSGKSRSVSVTTGDLIINGSVDEDILKQIQEMMDQQAEEIYENISNQLTY